MLTSANPPRKVFNTIQILRGLAALIVVLFHLSLGNERRGQPPLVGGLFQHGFAGVDLFFVISGFVIMHTSHVFFNKPDYFGTYFRKRLIRIYPIYWVTFVCIVGGLLSAELITNKSIEYLPKPWYLLINSFLLLPNHPDINGVTWSLSYELYYYLVFGLLILSRQLWLPVVLILALSGIYTLNPDLFTQGSLLAFFLSPYNLEFASGVFAWWIIHRYKLSTLLYGLLLPVSGAWLLVNSSPLFEEPSKRVVLYGISSFLIVLSITGIEYNGWFRSSYINQLLMKIGDASYLIYIFHFPILYFYGKVASQLLPGIVGQHIAAIVFTIAITTIGIYLHIHVEAPLVKKLNLLVKPVRPRPNNG